MDTMDAPVVPQEVLDRLAAIEERLTALETGGWPEEWGPMAAR